MVLPKVGGHPPTHWARIEQRQREERFTLFPASGLEWVPLMPSSPAPDGDLRHRFPWFGGLWTQTESHQWSPQVCRTRMADDETCQPPDPREPIPVTTLLPVLFLWRSLTHMPPQQGSLVWHYTQKHMFSKKSMLLPRLRKKLCTSSPL